MMSPEPGLRATLTGLRFAANLSFLFTEVPFLDRFEAAAKAGFRAVEFTFPYDFPVEDIASRLRGCGLALVLFNLPPGDWAAGERGLTAIGGREADYQTGLARALDYAAALGCRRLHAMAGLTCHGADRSAFVSNLRRAAVAARSYGIDVLIEPINTKDMPGYFLTRTKDAADIICEVAEPNVGLQLDLYHRHLMEGSAGDAIADYAHITRHYQIASPPDRAEPDASDLDFRPLLERIAASGYDGFIGCEYRPRNGTLAGLVWMERLGVSPS